MAFWEIGKSKDKNNEQTSNDASESLFSTGKKKLKGLTNTNDSKKTVEEDSTFIDKGMDKIKEKSLQATGSAIKLSGLAIRKVYEARLNIVNEFSNVKNEWSFIDQDTVRKDIEKLQKDLKDARSDFKKDKVSIGVINRISERLAITTSLLDDSLCTCEKVIAENDLTTPFALYGVKSLRAIEKHDMNDAISYAMSYYKANGFKADQPQIAFYIAQNLNENGKYNEALNVIKLVVKSYPENISVHKLLCTIHTNTGNKFGVALESEIISLLESSTMSEVV